MTLVTHLLFPLGGFVLALVLGQCLAGLWLATRIPHPFRGS
jgi:hypothetical protein